MGFPGLDAFCGGRLCRLLTGLAVGLLLLAGAAGAEAPPGGAAAPVVDETARGTPRGSVMGFLAACERGDYERAAAYLDVRGVAGDPASLARQLREVLARTLRINLENLSEDPEGDRGDGLVTSRDRLGRVDLEEGPVDIILHRVSREDGERIWKFAGVTVAQVPDLYARYGYGWLERYLPRLFFEYEVLEIALWQWIGLLVLVPLAAAASWLLAFALVVLLRPMADRQDTTLDRAPLLRAAGPMRLLIGVACFTAGTRLLDLTLSAQDLVGVAARVVSIFAMVWLLLRLVDVAAERIQAQMQQHSQAQAGIIGPGRKAVKLVLAALGLVAALDTLGFSVTAIVASLGVGGIAVALASQKTIENLFGGATLYADAPVRVGDFCRFGDMVGTVEEIGMRSTRVRTLDRTLVSVPNADFAAIRLENFAVRDRMRFFTTIGVRYETTPDQLRHLLVEIRRLLYAHEKVLRDPARVRLVGFGAYSIDLEIFAYVDTRDWNEFMGIREDLLLRIMDLVAASGTSFAFPSQTLYLGRDGGLPPEAVQRAGETVDDWRRRAALYLPDFPLEEIEALRGSVRFPPEGAPGRPAPGGGDAEAGG